MNNPSQRFVSLTTAVSLVLFGSPALLTAESGAFDPSTAARFDQPVLVETDAFNLDRLVGTQTQFIRYEATEYQRKVAEARAKAYMASQRKSQPEAKHGKTAKNDSTPSKKGKKDEPKKTADTAKPKMPRYIAVDTVKDKRASPNAKKVVMIWDVEAEHLVGNSVYDVSNPPEVGTTAKFEAYSAQYIGAGL